MRLGTLGHLEYFPTRRTLSALNRRARADESSALGTLGTAFGRAGPAARAQVWYGHAAVRRYRCTENVNLPFRVLAVIKEHGRTRVEANVKVKANFNVKLFALNVVIRIPLPPNTAVAKVTVAAGKAKFEPENQALVWRYG